MSDEKFKLTNEEMHFLIKDLEFGAFPATAVCNKKLKKLFGYKSQAEKLAEALRGFEDSGYGWRATEALAEFEKWKEGEK